MVKCGTALPLSYTAPMRFLLAMAFVILTRAALAQEPLVFASDAASPPFAHLDESGEIAGLERDLADALCLVLQRPCRFIVLPWQDLAESVRLGDADLAFAGLSATTADHLGLDATPPYLDTASRFAVIAGNREPATAGALQNFTIGALWGSPHALWLARNIPVEGVQRFPDAEEMYLSLHAGTIDLVFNDGLVLYLDFLRSPLGAGAKLAPLAVPLETDGGGYVLAMAPDSTDKALIAEAIGRLRVDGTLERLIAQHLPGF